MEPMNKHIKVSLVTHSINPAADGVLMPDGYKAVQEWQSAVITDISDDCISVDDYDVGSVIVFPGNMLLSVTSAGEQYHFVQENYVICKSGS